MAETPATPATAAPAPAPSAPAPARAAPKRAPPPNPLTVPPNIRDPARRRRAPLAAIGTGLRTTLKVFFRKPVTFEYPEVRRPQAERYRGRIGLELDLCIGCTLCAQVCPNGTCFMTDQDFAYEKSAEMAKRFPNKRNIYPAVEIARCIYCALCEEVCPTGAIHMTPEFETSRKRKDMVYMPDILNKTEAEIDELEKRDPVLVKKRFETGGRLIAVNDAERRGAA